MGKIPPRRPSERIGDHQSSGAVVSGQGPANGDTAGPAGGSHREDEHRLPRTWHARGRNPVRLGVYAGDHPQPNPAPQSPALAPAGPASNPAPIAIGFFRRSPVNLPRQLPKPAPPGDRATGPNGDGILPAVARGSCRSPRPAGEQPDPNGDRILCGPREQARVRCTTPHPPGGGQPSPNGALDSSCGCPSNMRVGRVCACGVIRWRPGRSVSWRVSIPNRMRGDPDARGVYRERRGRAPVRSRPDAGQLILISVPVSSGSISRSSTRPVSTASLISVSSGSSEAGLAKDGAPGCSARRL